MSAVLVYALIITERDGEVEAEVVEDFYSPEAMFIKKKNN